MIEKIPKRIRNILAETRRELEIKLFVLEI